MRLWTLHPRYKGLTARWREALLVLMALLALHPLFNIVPGGIAEWKRLRPSW